MSNLPAVQTPPLDLAIIDQNTGAVMPLSNLNIIPSAEQAYPWIPALEDLVRDAKIMLARLQMVVQDDLKKREASERFVGGRTYKLKVDSNWRVDSEILYRKLKVLMDSGDLPKADFEKAISVVVGQTTYSADNGVLNRLVELGGEVKAVIDAHRVADPKTKVIVK